IVLSASGLCPSVRRLSWFTLLMGTSCCRGGEFIPRAKLFRDSRLLHPPSHKFGYVIVRFLFKRGNQVVQIKPALPAGIEHVPRRFSKCFLPAGSAGLDRKSTRLNSSHTVISYAVFCLKKKTNTLLERHNRLYT